VNVEYRSRASGRRFWWLLVALAALLVGVAVPAVQHLRETPPPPPAPVRATWTAPPEVQPGAGPDFPFGLALAPDGRRVVFPGTRDGVVQLWLQDLRTGAVTALPGSDAATLPFWSPDGSRIGFFAAGAVRALDVDAAAVAEVTAAETPRGGTWNARGDLVFAGSAEGGLTLRTADGTTRTLTSPDTGAGELAHVFPVFLPDGEHLVFFVRAKAEAQARQGVWLTTTTDPSRRERLVGTASQAVVAAGRLVFSNDGVLVAQDLDLAARRLTGRATVLGVSVGQSPHGQLLATAADDVLIFSPPVSSLRQLAWVTRAGEPAGTLGSPGDTWSIRIAPDGRRVAATMLEPLLRTLDVVLYDGTSLVPGRVSLSIDTDESPAWSPDGLRVAWASAGRALTMRGAGAVLPAETIRRFDELIRVTDWTPDGSAVVVSRTMAATRDDLWLVPVRGGGEPRAMVETPFADVQGVVSPDGRWMAYASDESGRLEIYVEALRDRSPGPGTRERVTSGGGSDPRWSRDGRELFFRRGSGIHVATPALGRGQSAAAATSMLFETKADLRTFDVTPDGQRFLLNLSAAPTAAPPATLLVNWR
jgi:Tol biopolymer transport system component